MCGRFNITDDPFLQALLADLGINMRLPTRVNIAPTESVPVIRGVHQDRELVDMRWWLVPAWARQPGSKFSMFNARSETVADSKAFARPFRSQRGIIPASSYIEWQTRAGTKTPFLLKPAQGAIAFAAIWDHWQGDGKALDSCAMLTTTAPPPLSDIHHRMPVMLRQEDIDLWLDRDAPAGALQTLLRPELPADITAQALPPAIGNSRNKDPGLLKATGEVSVFHATTE